MVTFVGQMIPDVFRCFQVIPDATKGFHIFPDDSTM